MAKNYKGKMTGDPVTYQIPAPAGGVQMETFIPWTLVKRSVRREVITPIDAPAYFQKEALLERAASKQVKNSPILRALGLAHYWQRLLDEGKYRSLSEIATDEGIARTQVSRISKLTSLAPKIIQDYMVGEWDAATLDHLAALSRSTNWRDQFGMQQINRMVK